MRIDWREKERAPSDSYLTTWPWISVSKGSKLAQILDDQFYDLWKHSDTEHLDTLAKMAKWLK
jgi:hypothetical protein